MSIREISRIRYSTRDLLFLTAFLAVYLTVFSRTFLFGDGRDFDGKLVGILFGAIFMFAYANYSRRYAIRELSGESVSLPIAIPWPSLLFLALLDTAIASRLWTDHAEIGVSGVMLGSYFLLLRRPHAVVGSNGVIYFGSGVWSWEKVTPDYDESGVLESLTLGNHIWGRKIVVPPELREPVEAILRQHLAQITAPAEAARQ